MPISSRGLNLRNQELLASVSSISRASRERNRLLRDAEGEEVEVPDVAQIKERHLARETSSIAILVPQFLPLDRQPAI